MPTKFLIYSGMMIGSLIGGYIPTFFGVNMLSIIPIFTSSLGAVVGVYIGYKLSKY